MKIRIAAFLMILSVCFLHTNVTAETKSRDISAAIDAIYNNTKPGTNLKGEEEKFDQLVTYDEATDTFTHLIASEMCSSVVYAMMMRDELNPDQITGWEKLWTLEKTNLLLLYCSNDRFQLMMNGFGDSSVICKYVSTVDQTDENYLELYGIEENADGKDTFLVDIVGEDPLGEMYHVMNIGGPDEGIYVFRFRGNRFGASFEEVRDREPISVYNSEEGVELDYKLSLSGFDDSIIHYNFGTDGLSSIVVYYSNDGRMNGVINDYQAINNELTRKYGKPLGLKEGKHYTLTGYYLDQMIKDIGSGLLDNMVYDYDEWCLESAGGFVKIDHMYSCSTSVTIGLHMLEFTYYSVDNNNIASSDAGAENSSFYEEKSTGTSQGLGGGDDPDGPWICFACSHENSTSFCEECGAAKPTWTCACGTINHRKFCGNCGKGYFDQIEDFNQAVSMDSEHEYQEAIAKLEKLGDFDSGTFETVVGDHVKAKGFICKVYYDQGTYLVTEGGDHEKIIESFSKAGEYQDAKQQIENENNRFYGALYDAGIQFLKNKKYDEAIEAFEKAGSYSNASEQILKIHYDLAEEALANNRWEKASSEFEAAKDYLDAPLRVQESYYKAAEDLLAKGDEAGAIELFSKIKDYSDSVIRIQKIHYSRAESALSEERWDDASKEFAAAGEYLDAQNRVKGTYYTAAVKKLTMQEYDEALKLFEKAGSYLDSTERIIKIHNILAKKALGNGETEGIVGAFVYFGNYEQDGNLENGKEQVEWEVIDVKEDRVLLLSRYAVDAQAYNSKGHKIGWEKSEVRKWLNSSFFQKCFSKAEQRMVLSVGIDNTDEKLDNGRESRATKDKVFLLSRSEARRYLTSSRIARCEAVENIKSKMYTGTDGRVPYFLRTYVSEYTYQAYDITAMGELHYNDESNVLGVRPAIWVNIKGINIIASNYIDSDDVIQNTGENKTVKSREDRWKDAIGAHIFFGNYEQDGNFENGKEQVEWEVIDVKEDRTLLISRFVLDAKTYNSNGKDYSWEKSSLRKWLNKDFYGQCFDKDEQKKIVMVNLDNKDEAGDNVQTGKKTKDKVFLLSYSEALQYLVSLEDSLCLATSFVKSLPNLSVKDGYAAYWLRTLASKRGNFANCILASGIMNTNKTDDVMGVRPAIWVNTSFIKEYLVNNV